MVFSASSNAAQPGNSLANRATRPAMLVHAASQASASSRRPSRSRMLAKNSTRSIAQASACQDPERPPRFSSRRTPSTTMPLSTALHMS